MNSSKVRPTTQDPIFSLDITPSPVPNTAYRTQKLADAMAYWKFVSRELADLKKAARKARL